MTIATNDDPRAGPYQGNDSQTTFPFSFKVFDESEVRVVLTDEDGVDTDLTLDSDFSLSLNADQNNNPGGTVTYPISGDPLPDGETLTIVSDIPYTQETDIQNAGAFYPEVIENAFDKATLLIKQVREAVRRTLTLPVSVPDGVDASLPVPSALAVIGWDANGQSLRNYSPDTSVSTDQLRERLAGTADTDDGDAMLGVKLPYSNAVARTQHEVNLERLTAAGWGCMGNGTTDDTANFADLESDITGQPVDLLGLTYKVTSLPSGNDYFNGSFKVGTDVFTRHRQPRAYPFEVPAATIRSIAPREGLYRGLNVLIFPIEGTSEWVLVWREAAGHATEDGTRLMAANTIDAGNTLTNIRLIYTTSTADTRNFVGGVMGSGRFGIVASRPQEAGTYLDPVFIYSDDDGATWASTALAPTDTVDFHGRIYPWPAGGASGFIAYGYRPTAEGGGITAWKTTDNGANWTEQLNVVPVTVAFPSISELAVARLGTQNKWVMVVRTSTGLNMGVATSTNMTTWTPLIDSGLYLSSNPPELIYDDGKLFVLTFSRTGRPIIDEFENALVVACGNAEDIYASGGTGWGGWHVITASTTWPTGYINVQKIRGRYYGLFTGAEDQPGNSVGRTAYLQLISSDVAETANARQMFAAIPQANSLFNGGLQVWQAGTSFNSFGSRAIVADGFTFARASFAAGATVTRQNGDKAQFCIRVRRDDGNSGTEDMNLVAVLPMQDSIPYRNKAVTLTFRARMGAGFSAADDHLTVQVRQTNNSGEQSITAAAGLFTTGDSPVQSSATGVTLDALWRDFTVTVGNVAEDTTQLSLRWTYTPVGTATNDYFEIELVKMEPGRVATPFVMPLLVDTIERAERYYQAKTVRSENGSRHIALKKMRAVPTVTVGVGTAGNITADGFELTHNAAADCTVVASAIL